MDAVIENEKLSTLVAVIGAAGLVEKLKGIGPFTVFAPNNDAFKQLPEQYRADLLKPENKEISKPLILKHVVPQTIMAANIENGETPLQTEGNEEITVTKDGQKVTIKSSDGDAEAEVTDTDVTATNGVVHIINKVLT